MIAPERELEITEHIIEMQQYLWRNAQRYREAPADTLLSQLVHAEIDGEKLEARALMSIAHQLLVAGNESTSGALSSGILIMLQDKSLQQRLIESPALIGNFVEEVLRHHSPSPHLYRQLKQDTRIGDVELKKDEVVMISYLAANHDPLVFDAPEAVCLDRQNGRKHMAFGRGIHFCIGNQLARAEMRIAFSQLLHRLPGMRLDPGAAEPDFAPLFHVHSLDRLPVLL